MEIVLIALSAIVVFTVAFKLGVRWGYSECIHQETLASLKVDLEYTSMLIKKMKEDEVTNAHIQ